VIGKIMEYILSVIGFLSGFSVFAFGNQIESKVKIILSNRLLAPFNNDDA